MDLFEAWLAELHREAGYFDLKPQAMNDFWRPYFDEGCPPYEALFEYMLLGGEA